MQSFCKCIPFSSLSLWVSFYLFIQWFDNLSSLFSFSFSFFIFLQNNDFAFSVGIGISLLFLSLRFVLTAIYGEKWIAYSTLVLAFSFFLFFFPSHFSSRSG